MGDSPFTIAVGTAATAAVVSWIVVRLVERLAPRLGMLDVPKARSSHVSPRPRGGGIGIVCGVLVALGFATAAGLALDRGVLTVLVATMAAAVVGLIDDLRDLSVTPRLGAQVAVSVAFVWAVGGLERLPLPVPMDLHVGWAGGPLAVLWLVGVANFFNFMDGADGLAGGQGLASLGLLTWLLWPAPATILAVAGAAATAAFLTRNWFPARVFLGDVGSGWLGYLLAALPFAVPSPGREDLVFLVAISLSLFLLDPVVTLVLRTFRGAPLARAHREHAYQRLFDPAHSHAPAVAALVATGVGLSVAAAVSDVHRSLRWPVVGLAIVAFLVEWWIAAGRSRGPR